jgi:hypothetical protein
MSARRFPWVLVAIAIFAVSPAIIAIIAGLIQSAFDCTANTCMVGGSNWASTLGSMQLGFWLIIVTWPIASMIFTVWLIVLAVHLWRRSKAERAA